MAIPWSEYEAQRVMWSEMDKNVSNGEMMAFFRKHLKLAFEAGRQAEKAALDTHISRRIDQIVSEPDFEELMREDRRGEIGS